MSNSTTKEKIVDAAKQLLSEVGYESMSPGMVLKRSGAGQGSLYHHFSGKKALAQAVLAEIAEELSKDVKTIFERADLSGAQKIDRFLSKERDGLKGCKLGRLSNEKAFRDDELRAPMQLYFSFVRDQIIAAVKQGQSQGEFSCDIDVEPLADLIISAVQGGYVLSKATNDASAIGSATDGARALLSLYRRGQK